MTNISPLKQGFVGLSAVLFEVSDLQSRNGKGFGEPNTSTLVASLSGVVILIAGAVSGFRHTNVSATGIAYLHVIFQQSRLRLWSSEMKWVCLNVIVGTGRFESLVTYLP